MRHILGLALVAFAGAASAQSSHDSHHKADAPAKEAAAPQTYSASGVVKSVNAEKGTVTIAHGPVESLKWPGMTMGFKPQDKTLLQTLKPGQKIEFEFQRLGKDYLITKVR